ncbi:TIGR03557 family F420-dependent LLM class oxidoreductase [Umezawaea sp. Da 62-37]|uniref:TIGR03557 family F420-dependent LLM class oxidoreductase n=1 Tax=Umezawaea sp. Da 62-37 TaxID=3075927 RepID=UPI0028F6FF4A|nr:TIGR03557 family F420-dependent LLM class oxidoreductase [Umezawaea sp. Da 62-37]WNV88146.1 TIGR03557 family F420-dependent LLM class oxidoreductase [Umezawaea sp. Da 62-37]
MVSIGYFLSCEEFGPRELVRQARLAEEAGFERLWISDHFHPWNGEQGQSPFVWSVIGALSEATTLPITTAVTCPTVRIHPAIVAQAAATAAVQCEGRFTLGVGSGEALNEHILGDGWPPAPIRLEMLEEAVEVIRALHTGEEVDHHGKHYTVENARLYTLPEQPVPIYVSAFAPKSAELAARIGDGFCSTMPDAELIGKYRAAGGKGPAQGGFKVCHAPTEREGVQTAHRLWANEQLPGELAQVLPTPKHFEQASTLVTEDMVAEALPTGPDPKRYLESLRQYADAGYDEVYVQQIGPGQDGFFDFWRNEVAPGV